MSWFSVWDGTTVRTTIDEIQKQKAAVTMQKVLVYGGLGLIVFIILFFIFRRK